MEATGAEGVTRSVQDVDVQSADGEHIPVSQLAVGTHRIDPVPQDPIGRMELERSTRHVHDPADRADVIIVPVGEQDSDDLAPGHCRQDRRSVVGRVDDDALVVVADEPNVVVDVPGATVKAEGARGDGLVYADSRRGRAHRTTTERRTSPVRIFSNADSMSPRPMVSDTNAPRSKRPWR